MTNLAAYYRRQHALCGDSDEFYLQAWREAEARHKPVGFIAGMRWWLCL